MTTRGIGYMASVCEMAAKWTPPKSVRASEAEDMKLTLRQTAELLQALRPHAAAIRELIGRKL